MTELSLALLNKSGHFQTDLAEIVGKQFLDGGTIATLRVYYRELGFGCCAMLEFDLTQINYGQSIR